MLNLPRGKRYLLACSFGPDSMALFSMLLKEKYRFEVAHVNYHLRPEAEEETRQLKAYCEKYHIPFHFLEVRDLAGQSSLEEKCRNIRYGFFKQLVKDHAFYALLVAHQEDDLLETYLMQKMRHNIVNYYGLKRFSVMGEMRLYRPLLNLTKKELLEYNRKHHVPYAIDSSNLKDDFLRNRFRHQVVEKLSWKERNSLLKEIEKKNQELAALKKRLFSLDASLLSSWEDLSREETAILLYHLLEAYDKNPALSLKEATEVRKALHSDKSNLIIPIKNGVFLYKDYDHVRLGYAIKDADYSYTLTCPQALETPYFYLDFTKGGENRNVHLSDYPITIRKADLSDKIPVGNYRVSLRRAFIDWKMPIFSRKMWPVIVNKKGEVIYTPRYQKEFVITGGLNFYVK